MLAAFFAWSYALVLFALITEVDTLWLRWVGFLWGAWMAIAGLITGYHAIRK